MKFSLIAIFALVSVAIATPVAQKNQKDARILDFLNQLGQSVADQIYDQADDKIKGN